MFILNIGQNHFTFRIIVLEMTELKQNTILQKYTVSTYPIQGMKYISTCTADMLDFEKCLLILFLTIFMINVCNEKVMIKPFGNIYKVAFLKYKLSLFCRRLIWFVFNKKSLKGVKVAPAELLIWTLWIFQRAKQTNKKTTLFNHQYYVQ